MKPIIGTREFVDGSVRAVHLDDDGRQFVIGDDGETIHGNWILTPELEEMTPIVIHRREQGK